MKTNTLNIKQAIIKGSVAFTLIMIAFAGNSQSLNVKGGVNMSRINFFDDDGARDYNTYEATAESGTYEAEYSYKMKTQYGWNAGVMYEFKSKRAVSFETGISYMTKGFKFEGNQTETIDSYYMSFESSSTSRIHYLDIPLTMKFNFMNNGVRVYGKAGAYFGVALVGMAKSRYESNYNGDVVTDEDEEEIDIEDDDLRTNAGLTLGLGVEYKNFFIEGNYSAGVMNLADMDYGFMVNKDLGISVGYNIQFNKEK